MKWNQYINRTKNKEKKIETLFNKIPTISVNREAFVGLNIADPLYICIYVFYI